MGKFLSLDTWHESLAKTWSELRETVGGFLPMLAVALVIIAVGFALAKVLEIASRFALRRLGVDRATERGQTGEVLRQAGLRSSASRAISRVLFWVLFVLVVLFAVSALGITAVNTILDRVGHVIPDLVAAALILAATLLLARVAGKVVGSGASAANLAHATRLGAAARMVVLIMGVILAMEQLGIETSILVNVITTVVAVLGVSTGIAFALSARPLVTHILAGHFLRQSLSTGLRVEAMGRQGEVERIGAVDTLFRDGESTWSIPNARLMEEVVNR